MTDTEFPVQVTPDALARVQRLIQKDGREGAFLRVGVKGGGCSGLEYVMRIENERKQNDLSSVNGEVELVCDPKSAKFLQGSTVTWTGNLIGGGFSFENPNASRSCGCGTSFTPKAS